ncbi:MAG: DUF2784 domain-containing protein [Acidobacteria bacterium]|nr:DUF2784 domain-containing protein [Acidobacteriota bacterium]
MAACISVIHLAWIVLVIFGAMWTRGRPLWTAMHLLALVWGIVVEVGPWPCPLTLAEEHFAVRAMSGGYIEHCVNAVVYPNMPEWVVATCLNA